MAKAYQCDICGEFYLPQNNNNEKSTFNRLQFMNGAIFTASFDLCPECIDSLKRWMSNRKALNEKTEENRCEASICDAKYDPFGKF